MNCVVCSSPILESTSSWIDLAECCNAQVHISCLEKLDATCPSCRKYLDIVVLNILDDDDVGEILETNAIEDDILDVAMQIFHVNEEAELVNLADFTWLSIDSSTSSNLSEDESGNNSNDPHWDSSQANYKDSNQ